MVETIMNITGLWRFSKTINSMNEERNLQEALRLMDMVWDTQIVPIEESTKFLRDSSFDNEHKKILDNTNSYNHYKINCPKEDKIHYYKNTYWINHGINQTIWDINYFYDYDSEHDEIILNTMTNIKTNEIHYEYELTDDDKDQLVKMY